MADVIKMGMKRTQALDDQILVLTEALDAMYCELQQFKKMKNSKVLRVLLRVVPLLIAS